MDKAEILDFLNANPSCHLATVEEISPVCVACLSTGLMKMGL